MNDDDTSDEEQRGQRSGPPSRRSSGRGLMISVFGDIRRAGSWSPRRTMWPFAVFGDIDLDLRQATILPGEVVINAVAPFGNVEVLVPDGIQVDVGGVDVVRQHKRRRGAGHRERVCDGDPGAWFLAVREPQDAQFVTVVVASYVDRWRRRLSP